MVRTYRTRPHGTHYAAWSLGHPLTPYYRTKPTEPEWLPVHLQPGRLGYRDWVGLVLGDAVGNASTRAPAAAMLRAEQRLGRMVPEARRGTRAAKHGQRGSALGGAASLSHQGIDDQTVAVLHQEVTHVAEPGLLAAPLAQQPGIGIGGRGVGLVRALLTTEVALTVAPAASRRAPRRPSA